MFDTTIPHAAIPLFVCAAGVVLAAAAGAWRPRAALLVLLATAAGATAALAFLLPGAPHAWSAPWIPQWDVALGLAIDGLAAAYGLLAAGVAVLVALYAIGYMPAHLRHQQRAATALAPFALLLALFLGAMVGIATSTTLLQLFVFWEVTTICSYLLIGFDQGTPGARRAALMAMIVTGGTSVLLLAGALLLLHRYGTTAFDVLAAAAQPDALTATAVALVLVAALAKSAQWPLHFWLPHAMAAPTPVSAYLHAAAMVAAGVFLLQRLEPLLHLDATMAGLVVAAGSISMLAGGLAALREHEFKRVLAYSTIAQYGHVTLLVGLGGAHAASAAAFFVVAHGLCKSALFLSAGAVTMATGEKALPAVGGLGRRMPLLAAATAVAAAGLAGVPLTLGFFKDELLFAAAHEHGAWALALALSGPVLTIAYMTRFWTRIFLGPPRGHVEPISPLLVWPIGIAALLTLAGGVWPEPAARLASWAGGYTVEVAYHLDLRVTNAAALAAFAGAGLVLLARRLLVRPTTRIAGARDLPDAAYRWTLAALWRLGRGAHGLRPRELRARLAVVFVATAILIAAGATAGSLAIGPPDLAWTDAPVAAALAATAVAAVLTVSTRQQPVMVLLLSVTSLAMAGLFAAAGAPDVALVIVIINVVATLLLVALLQRLPPAALEEQRQASSLRRWYGEDEVLATVAAALAFVFAWGTFVQPTPDMSVGLQQLMLAEAAHAKNAVTAILVDFRGLDTLGEITVVVISVMAVEHLLRPKEEEEQG